MNILLIVSYVAFVLLLLLAASFTLGWMLYAWREPRSHRALGFSSRHSTRELSFSLIVPARNEESVLAETLRCLSGIAYPHFEILVAVGDDDQGTLEVARQCRSESPDLIRIVIDDGAIRSKPRSLNAALRHCTGDVVGVFDAEDDVHPDLLSTVADHFQATGSDVVQGGVQLMDYRSSWYSIHNVLEYFFWFRSRLHFHADNGFVPLGGNTVFIKKRLLVKANGWDEGCLAEDCEIGIRLSADGARISVCYDPSLVTREETPPSVGTLVRQRTRWNQGFLQVLLKGHWRRLDSRVRRALAVVTLSLPFVQGLVGLFIPISVVMIIFVKVPVWLALFSFLPLIPTVGTVAIQMAGIEEFGRLYGPKARLRDYLVLVLTAVPYQLVLSYGAGRAVWRQVVGLRGWELTPHRGMHRTPRTELIVDLTSEETLPVHAAANRIHE